MGYIINRLDSWCGVPLKQGIKFIVVIDMINSIGTGIFVGFSLLIILFYGDEIKIALDKDKAEFPDEARLYEFMGTGFVLWVLVIILLTSILNFLLAQSFLLGVQQNDATRIEKWIHVSVVFLFLRLAGLAFGTFMASDSPVLLFTGFLYTIYSVYCLWVVIRYRNDLLPEETIILRQWDHRDAVTNNNAFKIGNF